MLVYRQRSYRNRKYTKIAIIIIIIIIIIIVRTLDSVVGIATGYGMDDGGVGVRVAVGSKTFLLYKSSRPALVFQHPIKWVPAALSPLVKRPGHEADHSLVPRSRKRESYTSTPPYAFMV
jgi:hypothetical protein